MKEVAQAMLAVVCLNLLSSQDQTSTQKEGLDKDVLAVQQQLAEVLDF